LQLSDASGPTATDSSGNNQSGTYIGNVTFGVSGPLKNAPSTAISLAGSGTTSEGVSVNNPGAFAGTPYSIEIWVDAAPYNNYMTLWGYDGAHRLLLSASGQLLSQMQGNFYSKATLTRNVWHQVVFVYNGAGTASYYIDGQFDSSAAVSTSYAAFTSKYYLGQYGSGSTSTYKWIGRLGQEAFYLSALTASEIAQHYSAAGY
jgi:hypothetical protein